MLDFIIQFISIFGGQGDSRMMPAQFMAFVQMAFWFLVASVIISTFRLILSLIKGW